MHETRTRNVYICILIFTVFKAMKLAFNRPRFFCAGADSFYPLLKGV
jgi:hypothetical protein